MCAMNVLFRTFLTDTTVLHIHLQHGYMRLMMIFRIILKEVSYFAIIKKIYNKINIKVGKFRIVNILVFWVLLQKA